MILGLVHIGHAIALAVVCLAIYDRAKLIAELKTARANARAELAKDVAAVVAKAKAEIASAEFASNLALLEALENKVKAVL